MAANLTELYLEAHLTQSTYNMETYNNSLLSHNSMQILNSAIFNTSEVRAKYNYFGASKLMLLVKFEASFIERCQYAKLHDEIDKIPCCILLSIAKYIEYIKYIEL